MTKMLQVKRKSSDHEVGLKLSEKYTRFACKMEGTFGLMYSIINHFTTYEKLCTMQKTADQMYKRSS